VNPTSEDIMDMLEAESSLVLVQGTNLFVGSEPPEPNLCVTIFDTPGWSPISDLDGDAKLERPSFQIRVRAADYTTGYALIDSIKRLLNGRHKEEWSGTTYDLIRCTSDPQLLDWDEKKRPRFIINFDCHRA
jgi:hypothetical protein